MFAVFRDLGALAGLISAAFLLMDRFLRQRPFAVLTVVVEDYAPHIVLRITNPGRYAVILTLAPLPGPYRLSIDRSTLDVVRTTLNRPNLLTLLPSETIDLNIMTPEGYGALPDEAAVSIDIPWKFAQAVWFPTFPLRFRSTKQRMEEAAVYYQFDGPS